MRNSRSLIGILSTFIILLALGCSVVRIMPIGSVEGAICYLASVIGAVGLYAAHRKDS